MKRLAGFVVLLVFVLSILLASAALAGTSVGSGDNNASQSDSDLMERLHQVKDFKFYHHKTA